MARANIRLLGGAVIAAVTGWCVAAAPLAAQAVRVQGEVLDAVTGMPVRGVIVQFPLLGKLAVTDSLGYFEIPGIPAGPQTINAFHAAYQVLSEPTPIQEGDILEIKLTPQVIAVEGMHVRVRASPEIEARRSGTAYDYISEGDVDKLRDRTNKTLEILRAKAPPRLRIQQQGPGLAVKFCIESTRRTPSVQELRDTGVGCRPSMIIMDGVVLYAPPANAELGAYYSPDMPSDVAHIIVNLDPEEILSVRVLQPSQAYFRYGDGGRFGAVEIKTRKGRR